MSKQLNYFRIVCRYFSSNVNSRCTSVPKYPPILDLSPKEVKKRERDAKIEKYNSLHTVEEKLFALNLDKYYGWNCMVLKEHAYPYEFLSFVKFITRTYSSEVSFDTFHKIIGIDFNECKLKAESLRKHLQDAILFELEGKRCNPIDVSDSKARDTISNNVVEAVNSLLLSSLSQDSHHLCQSIVDYKPRLEAFWKVGSFQPSEKNYNDRTDEEKSDLVDHWIQYFGAPVVQLRNPLPLSPLETQIVEYNDSSDAVKVNMENSDPSLNYGLEFQRRHGTNIAGYWPGDEHEFGLLSYHNRGYLLDRPNFGPEEQSNTLTAQAILASYSWLHGQASNQGFSTFTDVTYPLVTQNVITNGQDFTFSLYQLNTTVLHSEHSLTNARTNLQFTLPSASLYSEIKGNEFFGWNDDIIATLIAFYMNEPQKKENLNLKPYLSFDEKYLSDITDVDRRVWLHKQFRHMYSNRPRCRPLYEIYDWERIYKIKFETRPMEARLRPFERDSNPTEDRKYNEHMPPYVPKQFRPKKKHWTGWRSKYAKTYYPDI